MTKLNISVILATIKNHLFINRSAICANTPTTQSNPNDLLEKSILKQKAEEGDPGSIFLMGFGYAEGRLGFSKDSNEALKWLNKYKDDWPTIIERCAIGFRLEKAGLINSAIFCYSYANNHKYIVGEYLYVNAMFNKLKDNVTNECIKSKLLLQMQTLSNIGFSPAMTFMAMRHLDGWGKFTINPEEGLKLLYKAAIKGDGPAKVFLAEIYKAEHSRLNTIKNRDSEGLILTLNDQQLSVILNNLREICKYRTESIFVPDKVNFNILESLTNLSNSFFKEDKNYVITPTDQDSIFIHRIDKLAGINVVRDQNKWIDINFNEGDLSEQALLLIFWIYGTPLFISRCSFAQAKKILQTTEKLNRNVANIPPYSICFSEEVLDLFKTDQSQIKEFFIGKSTFSNEIYMRYIYQNEGEANCVPVIIENIFNHYGLEFALSSDILFNGFDPQKGITCGRFIELLDIVGVNYTFYLWSRETVCVKKSIFHKLYNNIRSSVLKFSFEQMKDKLIKNDCVYVVVSNNHAYLIISSGEIINSYSKLEFGFLTVNRKGNLSTLTMEEMMEDMNTAISFILEIKPSFNIKHALKLQNSIF